MLSMLLISALAVAQYPTPAEKPAAQDTTRPSAQNRDTVNRAQSQAATTAAELKLEMRRLWSEHIALTHNYLVSAFAGLGDTAELAQRLLRNQDEIGDAIKPFYGPAAGQQTATMLRGHIQHATHLVTALKGSSPAMGSSRAMESFGQQRRDTTGRDTTMNARPSGRTDTTAARPAQGRSDMAAGGAQQGDTAGVDRAIAMLKANADSIAGFLNSANPRHWNRATLRSALGMHLDLLVQAARARARGDWDASIAGLDASHRQIQQLADVLTEGIVKQFPNRFPGRTTAMSRER